MSSVTIAENGFTSCQGNSLDSIISRTEFAKFTTCVFLKPLKLTALKVETTVACVARMDKREAHCNYAILITKLNQRNAPTPEIATS